jgi:hypothetical protein
VDKFFYLPKSSISSLKNDGSLVQQQVSTKLSTVLMSIPFSLLGDNYSFFFFQPSSSCKWCDCPVIDAFGVSISHTFPSTTVLKFPLPFDSFPILLPTPLVLLWIKCCASSCGWYSIFE